MSADRPGQDGELRFGKRLRPVAGLAAVLVVVASLFSVTDLLAQTQSSSTALPPPPAFEVAPDYAGLADNFLSGVTGWSPDTLGRYLDARSLADIGVSVSTGNFAEASRKTLAMAGDKAIGSIPVIGQWYALGQAGSELGNWAIDHFGSDRFDSAYRSVSSHFSEDDWNRTYGDGNLDAEIVIVENANVLTFIDKQTGGGHSHEDLRKMFWSMLQAKHRFEALCDEFGLTGAERSYENVAQRYQQKLELTAQVAQMIEADRVAAEKVRLKEAWRKDQEWQAKKKADEQARNAETCAAWLGKIAFDPDHHLPRPDDDVVAELCGERPAPAIADSKDDDQPADTSGTQDAAPADDQADIAVIDSPTAGMAGPLSWALASSGGDNQTTFWLTVTNTGSQAIDGVGISAAPIGPYEDGGVITGASRRSLAPGQSVVFEAIASGDVKAVGLSVLSATGPAETITGACVHETGINADGSYTGTYAGAGNSGEIHLVVRGRSVTGSLTGGYSDADQTVTISCAVSGAYDPKTGTLSANWNGAANGVYHDEKRSPVSEPLAGTLTGTLGENRFDGVWHGGSDFFQDTGEWSASQ